MGAGFAVPQRQPREVSGMPNGSSGGEVGGRCATALEPRRAPFEDSPGFHLGVPVRGRSLAADEARARKPRSGPTTVVKSTSVFACFEPLEGPRSCLMKQNSCAKNRSTPLDRLSEAIPCGVLAYLCLREQESFLAPHIPPASRAIDASPSLFLSGRVKCIRLMLCLSFFEWRCIYPGEQMLLAPFLEKTSLDRAPGRFADYLFVPKHPKADVLLTTVLGPLRRLSAECRGIGSNKARQRPHFWVRKC